MKITPKMIEAGANYLANLDDQGSLGFANWAQYVAERVFHVMIDACDETDRQAAEFQFSMAQSFQED